MLSQGDSPPRTTGVTSPASATPAPVPQQEAVNSSGSALTPFNVTEIIPDPISMTLSMWQGKKINIKVKLDNGREGTVNSEKIEWRSENSNIASVDNGVVSGIGNGMTNIVIKVGNIEKKVPVTVIDENIQGVSKVQVVNIVVQTPQISLGIGTTALLDAYVTLSDGTTNRDIIWSSENETLVSVDKNGNIKRLGLGEVNIVGVAKNDSRKKATIQVMNKQGEIPLVINTPKPADIISVSTPGYLKAENITETQATINWEKVTDADSYKIYLNDNFLTTNTSTSYTLTSLIPNTSYRVTIIAVKGAEESLPVIQDFKTTAPGSPKNLSSSSVSDNGFSISWDSVSSASKYKIYKDVEFLGESTTNSYTATSLIAGTTYNITITAIVNEQESAPSSKIAITLKPPAPSGINSRNITPTSFTLAWTGINGASSYKVYKNNVLYADSITGTSKDITGLSANTSYNMQVSAVNAGGESAKSTALSVTTAASVPSAPSAPTGLNKSNVTSTSFTLTWSAVSGASYKVYKDNVLYVDNVTGTSSNITGLTAGTTYSMQVSAVNAGGESNKSMSLNVITIPQTPTNLNWNNLTSTSFQLTWSAGTASFYKIYKNGISYSTEINDSKNITGVTAWVSYNMQVSAVNDSGESPKSNILVVTIPAYTITKWGVTGNADGQFNNPTGIAVDNSGNIYVADSNNNRIQKFNSNGTFITKWGIPNIYPEGIAIDSMGNIYITDTANHNVQKFNSNGTFIKKWGMQGTQYGQFLYPTGIAVDTTNNIYVADANNFRIQKFNSDGTFITKWGSSGSGDGQFNNPSGIAVDTAGNVYVADSNNNRIQKFSPQ